MARNPRPDNGEKRKLMTFAAGYVIAAAALRSGTTSGGATSRGSARSRGSQGMSVYQPSTGPAPPHRIRCPGTLSAARPLLSLAHNNLTWLNGWPTPSTRSLA